MLIHELPRERAPEFAGMTFPAFRGVLGQELCPLYPGESVERWVRPLAIGAEVGGVPLGLLLAGLAADGAAEVLSLFVHRDARRQGLGTRLLAGCEDLLRQRGIGRVEAIYLAAKQDTTPFERLIQRAGWERPAPRMLIYEAALAEAERLPWYGRSPAREGLEVFAWKDLTAEEGQALRRSHADRPWIDEDLLPWRFDRHGFEEASSLGVRLEGAVVGWVINHAVGGGDVVRFTCSFIRGDLARQGRLVAAYSESIRRLAVTSFRRCSFAVPIDKRGMTRFVERRCAPFAGRLRESRGAGKSLAGRPGSGPP